MKNTNDNNNGVDLDTVATICPRCRTAEIAASESACVTCDKIEEEEVNK